MYTRITRSGGRSYLQLVESFRTESGGVCQRVIANLGRLDKLKAEDLDPLINGLNRALGRAENTAQPVEYESARAYGDVYALHELWQSLGFGAAVKRALRSSRRGFDAEALVRAMVFNRLCAPDSKLGKRSITRTYAARRQIGRVSPQFQGSSAAISSSLLAAGRRVSTVPVNIVDA